MVVKFPLDWKICKLNLHFANALKIFFWWNNILKAVFSRYYIESIWRKGKSSANNSKPMGYKWHKKALVWIMLFRLEDEKYQLPSLSSPPFAFNFNISYLWYYRKLEMFSSTGTSHRKYSFYLQKSYFPLTGDPGVIQLLGMSQPLPLQGAAFPPQTGSFWLT